MDEIMKEAEFHVATAAAAAAAAAASSSNSNTYTLQHHATIESLESEPSDVGQWSVDDSNSVDRDSERTVRRVDENTDFTTPQYGWVEITTSFFEACDELNLGELAQDMLFGLFEAMSAIEIMDPKMDVGMGYNKNDAQPHTFESAVEAGVLKLENFTNKELIGLFDSLFACLVSWLDGNSMDQVLLTCLYLHSPTSIKDKGLRSFCHAVRSLIVIIKNIVLQSSVNEEEDFQLFGNSAILANEDVQPATVAAQIKEAEDEWVKQSKKFGQADAMAVVHRLRFMRHFFLCIYQFESAMATAPDEHLINEIYRNINAILELVPQLKRTVDKGTQPLPGSDLPNPMGFSTRIHDRTQPPTFPRSIKLRDRLSSLQFIEELVQRLKYACKVIKMRDYYSVLNFFIDFSRKSGQCILSRSILQGLFISNRRLVFGTIALKDFLWDSVRAFNSPPVLNPKNPVAMNFRIQMYLDTFFGCCIHFSTFTQFIRICGYNRARQRDKLGRFIENFNGIQCDAARLDSHLTMQANEKAAEGNESQATSLKLSAQFSTWVLYNCFRAMMLYLMSGFELELYSVHEFLYIYWYPYELLIGFIVSALTRTENNLIVQEEYAEQQNKIQAAATGGNTTKNRKPKSKKNKKQLKPYRQEIVFYHAMLSLCGGFYKAMGALTKDGRIRQPMSKFDNEEIRFNRRFQAFANLTSPPPVSYTEFKCIREHMMQPSSSEIYAIAAKHFDQARNVLESIQNPEQEILDLLQVAKTNFVVMNVLAKGHQKSSKRQPEFDFSKHRHFPIIRLT